MTPVNRSAAGGAELVELDRTECLRLLATGDVGRVVFTEAAMPAALPVAYLLDGEEVVFRTGEARAFAAIRRAVVGFQCDEIDRTSRTGWTVFGVGQAYEMTDPERLATVCERLPATWLSRQPRHVVALPLHHLTGHRVLSPAARQCAGPDDAAQERRSAS
jgi:nitroimidazol reductase NimA-like FMN-containing flavoprotein (pyridoxamine 5'-phosphate oxidase superfamily)